MFDVVALGELLIDFTPNGISSKGNTLFERNPGGAPANVQVAVSRLGGTAAFIGKVGRDEFGLFLMETLKSNGVDTSGLTFCDEYPTTLAVVQLSREGNRTFTFYRSPGADTMLTAADVPESVIMSGNIFHFGSISLTDEPSREATFYALELAKKHNKIISFDPNLRPALWKSSSIARDMIIKALPYTDILKLSEEELTFVTGEHNLEKGSAVFEKMGITMILVTLGPKGTFYRFKGKTGHLYTYDTKICDTTGSGDAFLGGVLYSLKGKKLWDIKAMSTAEVEEIVDFSNAVGAMTGTKKGAIPAIPTLEEVKYCRNNIKKLIIQKDGVCR